MFFKKKKKITNFTFEYDWIVHFWFCATAKLRTGSVFKYEIKSALIRVLKESEFRELLLYWFKSYLNDSYKWVKIPNLSLSMGVRNKI